jgi:hypothetical protein
VISSFSRLCNCMNFRAGNAFADHGGTVEAVRCNARGAVASPGNRNFPRLPRLMRLTGLCAHQPSTQPVFLCKYAMLTGPVFSQAPGLLFVPGLNLAHTPIGR